MLAGHVGVGLALGRAARPLNVGWFIAGALLLDLLLWSFILLGWESVAIPGDFAVTRQAAFEFPYSHSLAGAVVWSLLAGLVAAGCLRRDGRRVAAVAGAAVLSHWFLDALVHGPELPLLGAAGPRVGLGLWNHLPLALAVEAVISLAGLALFLAGCALPRGRRLSLAALTLLVLGFTVAGMTAAPAPPSAAAMAGGSLATLLLIVALAGWFGRARRIAHES